MYKDYHRRVIELMQYYHQGKLTIFSMGFLHRQLDISSCLQSAKISRSSDHIVEENNEDAIKKSSILSVNLMACGHTHKHMLL